MMKWFKYIVLGLCAFIFFVYATFPYDHLREWLRQQAGLILGPTYELQIDELSPHWFSVGLTYDGVALLKKPDSGGEKQAWLRSETIEVDLSLLSTLMGSPEAEFRAQFGDGELRGMFARREGIDSVSLALDAVRLKLDVAGIKFVTQLDGDVELQLEPGNVKATNGSADLTINPWRVLKGSKLQLGSMGEINLAEMNLDALTLAQGSDSGITLDIVEGVINVERLKLAGGDITTDLSGKMYLDKKLSNSRISLKGNVGFSEKVKAVVPVSLFGAANPDDGSFPLSLSGRASRLKKTIGTFSI